MRLILSMALLTCLAGCGHSQQSSQPSSETLPGRVVTPELARKVTGHYAERLNLATLQQLPIVGKVAANTQIYRLAELRENNGSLVLTERACRVNYTTKGPLTISVANAATRALPASVSSLRVWEDEGVVKFARDPHTLVAGAVLENPAKDPLPTRPNDARVIDVDADGKPGLTTSVTASLVSGQVYIVQRSTTSFSGTQDADGNLFGLVQDKSEQSVLDASNFFLKIGATSSTQDPDAKKSTIQFVKLTDGGDCDSVDFDSLFGAS